MLSVCAWHNGSEQELNGNNNPASSLAGEGIVSTEHLSWTNRRRRLATGDVNGELVQQNTNMAAEGLS